MTKFQFSTTALFLLSACNEHMTGLSRRALECTPYTPGLAIDRDVTLCPGWSLAAVEPGQAAMTVVADHVTVTCDKTVDDTILDGDDAYGSVESPTIGLLIERRAGVTIRGCRFHGFRYGIVARLSREITIENVDVSANFSSPEAGWVQDSVQGGGIRFDGVEDGRIENSTIAGNWNGVELRGSARISVHDNYVDHCSNTGATLVATTDSELFNNDFSWAIRGAGLAYPSSWYGIDTKDSAGIIIDAGSRQNRITHNNVTFGGDGIFIRAVIGGCAEDNFIEENDASGSPHNALECWCDGNVFRGNVASDSHYGIWLGGTDRATVENNRVERNVVDGISIQIGEDRHSVIADNQIRDNGRVGLLLSGREYQAWDTLDHWAPALANSSHLVVQRNSFSGNQAGDVFATSTRSLVLASNCGSGGGAPSIRGGREAELIVQMGQCGGANNRTAPSAVLDVPTSVPANQPFTVDASRSIQSGTETFTWLVQPSSARFLGGTLPTAALARAGSASESISLPPGIFDVDVTVGDGALASLAWQRVAALPQGLRIGESASDWQIFCSVTACTQSIDDAQEAFDGAAIHIKTDAAYDFAARVNVAANLSTHEHLGFFVRARNDNFSGWQTASPVIVLGSQSGVIRYVPSVNLLPTDGHEWVYVDVPLAGGAGWSRTDEGASLAQIDWIEIHADTWGWLPVELWLDGVTAY